MTKVLISVDPHKLSVTIEVVDDRETVPATGRFNTDKTGYAAMRKHVAAWSGPGRSRTATAPAARWSSGCWPTANSRHCGCSPSSRPDRPRRTSRLGRLSFTKPARRAGRCRTAPVPAPGGRQILLQDSVRQRRGALPTRWRLSHRRSATVSIEGRAHAAVGRNFGNAPRASSATLWPPSVLDRPSRADALLPIANRKDEMEWARTCGPRGRRPDRPRPPLSTSGTRPAGAAGPVPLRIGAE